MKRWLNRIVGLLVLLAVAGAVVWAFVPRPVVVDTARITRGPLRVTVDDDGKTRIKEKYIVSSPLNGRLLRIGLDPGDAVEIDQTQIALLEPRDPELLDARAIAEAKARVRAAEAAVEQSRPAADAALAEMQIAESEYHRISQMYDRGGAMERERDDAQLALRMKAEAYKAARFGEAIAKFELELARAAMVTTTIRDDAADTSQTDTFVIRSPSTGRVLRVFQQSAAVVSAGSPLIEIGDPSDIELVVDVLSSDAVRIKPGAAVVLEQWGGDEPLQGIVRLVEPAAFTKVSALGVEEQRVNVVIDFTDSPDLRPALGDGYRVEARIVIWQADDVLRVPTSALFRDGDAWAVFVVRDQVARTTHVQLGGRTGLAAHVIEGLSDGDTVIIHPSDQITDGSTIRPR